MTAFVTNTARGQLPDLELRHRRRARCEDRIRAAKDTGLANLPLHGFDQNRIWCAIVQLAMELTAWLQMLALADHPARRWEPKRLRLRLFSIAGRIASHARQTRLRLSAHAPWAGLLTTSLSRPNPTDQHQPVTTSRKDNPNPGPRNPTEPADRAIQPTPTAKNQDQQANPKPARPPQQPQERSRLDARRSQEWGLWRWRGDSVGGARNGVCGDHDAFASLFPAFLERPSLAREVPTIRPAITISLIGVSMPSRSMRQDCNAGHLRHPAIASAACRSRSGSFQGSSVHWLACP